EVPSGPPLSYPRSASTESRVGPGSGPLRSDAVFWIMIILLLILFSVRDEVRCVSARPHPVPRPRVNTGGRGDEVVDARPGRGRDEGTRDEWLAALVLVIGPVPGLVLRGRVGLSRPEH